MNKGEMLDSQLHVYLNFVIPVYSELRLFMKTSGIKTQHAKDSRSNVVSCSFISGSYVFSLPGDLDTWRLDTCNVVFIVTVGFFFKSWRAKWWEGWENGLIFFILPLGEVVRITSEGQISERKKDYNNTLVPSVCLLKCLKYKSVRWIASLDLWVDKM